MKEHIVYLSDEEIKKKYKYKKTGLAEYYIWRGMRYRCSKENDPAYKNYGGRGITVCERWQKFENFYADMGPRPHDGLSLDRIDNDGNYEPFNCRWATASVQSKNKRKPSKRITLLIPRDVWIILKEKSFDFEKEILLLLNKKAKGVDI